MTILVIDVSQYQPGSLDYRKWIAAGVRGVYSQATQGNDIQNPHFEQQIAEASAAGLAVGAYHFDNPLPDEAGHQNRDPRGQATLFAQKALRVIGSAPLRLPPMQDVEWPVLADWPKWGVTEDSLARWVVAFADCTDADWGRSSGIYTGPAFWSLLPADIVAPLASRHLWAAAYPVNGPVVVPPIHAPPTIAPWGAPSLWQFTSDYLIPGEPRVDGSVFLGTEEEWSQFVAK
jgi:GH25 family lysozyme M1 (1,4-beta-N-acetylmuramidase)